MFEFIWKTAIIASLLGTILQLGRLEEKFDNYFNIPDVVFEEVEDGKDINK